MFNRACHALGIALIAASASYAVTAHADDTTTVNLTLEDATSNPGMSDMEIKADRYVVPAGKVDIKATNKSKALLHEVLVTPAPDKPLPYNANATRLVESNMYLLGEIDDLKPGDTGQKVFNLKPGKYLLFCNQAGHFKDGMYTELTVVAPGTKIEEASKATAVAKPATVEAPMPADAEGS